MGNTKIEWSDRTWNPTVGCTKVSPGCDHCYAKTMHERFHGPGTFDTVTLHPERLNQPARWRKPARVFVDSMSDLFHQDVPDEHIVSVFDAMANASKHTFQILTKRHARMRSFVTKYAAGGFMPPSAYPVGVLPNVWLGVSVENQRWADIRIPALLAATPAAVRFLSCEPMLGPIDLAQSSFIGGDWLRSISWVICGGESGAHARPMDVDWARSLRDQCVNAGIAFFFKQWGEFYDGVRLGKKEAGRILDGREWSEYPQTVTA